MIGHGNYTAPDVVKQIGSSIGAKRVQDGDVTAVLGERPVSEKVMTRPLPPMTDNGAPPPIAPSAGPVPTTAKAVPPVTPPAATPSSPQ